MQAVIGLTECYDDSVNHMAVIWPFKGDLMLVGRVCTCQRVSVGGGFGQIRVVSSHFCIHSVLELNQFKN